MTEMNMYDNGDRDNNTDRHKDKDKRETKTDMYRDKADFKTGRQTTSQTD